MRDYGKISPQFWIGKTGKALRNHGLEAQIVALYLLSCPSSNMLGIYYLPVQLMGYETGLLERASIGLQRAIEAGFCHYDADSEVVWVVEMAHYQIAESLDSKDNRCRGIQKDYDQLINNPFLPMFFDKYQADFHLTSKRENGGVCASPLQALHNPLRSQEQEQEQEQEQKQEQKAATKKSKSVAPSASLFVLPDGFPVDEWEAFVEMRKAAKKAMTDHAKELMVKKLLGFAGAGYDVKAILNASIMGGWSGVYEPKVKPVVAGSVGSKLGVHGQATAENAKRFIESMQANGGNQ